MSVFRRVIKAVCTASLKMTDLIIYIFIALMTEPPRMSQVDFPGVMAVSEYVDLRADMKEVEDISE